VNKTLTATNPIAWTPLRSWTLPSDPKHLSPTRREARNLAADTLTLTDDQLQDLKLAVGELLTNIIEHSNSPVMTIAVLTRPGAVRVEISQDGYSNVPSHTKTVAWHRMAGRGLTLVANVTSRWGINRSDHKTTVWFEIDGETKPEIPG
jgi:anti-sigma regulatory factor (Ser/Thr protein kinase)